MFCLFSIANLDILLTVHLSIIYFSLFLTWYTVFRCTTWLHYICTILFWCSYIGIDVLLVQHCKSCYFVDRASQYNLFFFIPNLIHCFSLYHMAALHLYNFVLMFLYRYRCFACSALQILLFCWPCISVQFIFLYFHLDTLFFVVPHGCITFVQFCFDVLISV